MYKLYCIYFKYKKYSLFGSLWHAARALPTVAQTKCLAAGTQSVGKRTGGMYPNGTLRRGLAPKTTKT